MYCTSDAYLDWREEEREEGEEREMVEGNQELGRGEKAIEGGRQRGLYIYILN